MPILIFIMYMSTAKSMGLFKNLDILKSQDLK